MSDARHGTLLTIGHSNHSEHHFLELLATHDVEAVADVRSWPRSRFAPWASPDALAATLATVTRRYVFLGRALGGRPSARECYDEAGHVLYGRVARTPEFETGVERLVAGMSRYRIAVMCSEEDPTHCHRRLLLSKVLIERFDVQVVHIRGNGAIEPEPGVRPPAEISLFDHEDAWWRSTQSVLQRR